MIMPSAGVPPAEGFSYLEHHSHRFRFQIGSENARKEKTGRKPGKLPIGASSPRTF